MTTPHRAPALFISHGSPMFALEPGALGERLRQLGQSLQGVRAVLVVSPHWLTRGLGVMVTPQPETVHDFGGFPPALYQLQYPAPGAPEVAMRAAHLLHDAGFAVGVSDRQGLDHGAWVPLMHLLPDAKVPVFQVSLPHDITPEGALRLGQALAPLRDEGVLIVGSGSMTHNLHELRRMAGPAGACDPYVREFTDWVRAAVKARSTQAMAQYRTQAPHAVRAHPSDEHFLPLHVALGASSSEDAWELLGDEVRYETLSMESYAWGLN